VCSTAFPHIKVVVVILTVYSENQRWGRKETGRETHTQRKRERDFMLKAMVQPKNMTVIKHSITERAAVLQGKLSCVHTFISDMSVLCSFLFGVVSKAFAQ